jgi:hypothetical protein
MLPNGPSGPKTHRVGGATDKDGGSPSAVDMSRQPEGIARISRSAKHLTGPFVEPMPERQQW